MSVVYAAFRDILMMEWTQSSHFTDRKDKQTRFGAAPVLETMNVGLNVFDVIPTPMWSLYFFFPNNAIISFSSKSNFSAFLPSAGKKFAAACLNRFG